MKSKPIKAVFLDRDGVINRYPGHKKYVLDPKGFHIFRGTGEAIRNLSAAGYKIYVISNQACIGKNLMTARALGAITRKMRQTLRADGARLDGVFYCPHLQEARCGCRKPRTGLLRRAVKGARIDRKNSYFIGDSILDVKTGQAFGVKTILVLSGREKKPDASRWEVQPDFVARDLFTAASRILAGKYERA